MSYGEFDRFFTYKYMDLPGVIAVIGVRMGEMSVGGGDSSGETQAIGFQRISALYTNLVPCQGK